MADIKKIVYIIRWVKNEKPLYQFGEMLNIGQGKKYLPAPPELFYTINSIFRYLKNNLADFNIFFLTMGFDDVDTKIINDFIKQNPFIKDCTHLSKPIGKKADGTPYKVFMVDSDFENLKSIKKIIIDQHFEIMGITRDAEKALIFFEKYYKHIDIVIIEILLDTSVQGYEIIKKMKNLKKNLKIIIVTKSNNILDVQKAIELKISGYIIKPVVNSKLIESIKKALN